MALARWEPFRELQRMQDEFNRAFDDRMMRWNRVRPEQEDLSAGFAPAVDVFEEGDSLVLMADLPGMDPKDVDLRIENNVLTLHGERKLEHEDKKDNYQRIERSYGVFTRSFTLPTVVDADKVKAEFKNGVLRVTLPKKEESKPRSIRVKVD